MPEIEAQEYEILPPPETTVWRYVSLAKFLALCGSRSLFLCRADLLSDTFEGSFSNASLQNHANDWGSTFPANLVKLMQWIPCRSFVNCWHVSNAESAALWKIYSGSESSVAVQSTIGTLQKLFPELMTKDGNTIVYQSIRRVQYIDYRAEAPHINDLMGPLCYKRQAFRHEQEIRLIRQELPTGPAKDREGSCVQVGPPPKNQGIEVPVDLTELIDAVYLVPSSPKWFLNVVQEVMRKFDLDDIPCRQSTLDELPDYGRFTLAPGV